MDSCFLIEQAIKKYNAIANNVQDCTKTNRYLADFLISKRLVLNHKDGGFVTTDCLYKCLQTTPSTNCNIIATSKCFLQASDFTVSNQGQLLHGLFTFKLKSTVAGNVKVDYYIDDTLVETRYVNTPADNVVVSKSINFTSPPESVYIYLEQGNCKDFYNFSLGNIITTPTCGITILEVNEGNESTFINELVSTAEGFNVYEHFYAINNHFVLVINLTNTSFPLQPLELMIKDLYNGVVYGHGSFFGTDNLWRYKSITGSNNTYVMTLQYAGNNLSSTEKQVFPLRLIVRNQDDTCEESFIFGILPNGN